ncbi:DgyrCDS5745 [Dimorphilus gyrociliatus]|uniref:DgyrCDS5745 n=1 Tax=Dimorphilus gyrociliatus TaxID=2664684 RepID=A0A7I8VKT7_9ANNE|nr:DgyrCDS5745 [Dimorphilus gyrociliatus]
MNSLASFLIFCTLLGTEALSLLRHQGLKEPEGHIDRKYLPAPKWFEQKLDHFNPADTRTWKQKYYVNSTFYKPGGPVFLQIGGEGPASPKWMVQGEWIEFAKRYNAYCIQIEHRFYGDSHPTKNVSVENLRYLTSEQALRDLANFRVKMSSLLKMNKAKWVSFGGSYSGALSAWFRAKYPHLVHAAVASSAPLFAKVNFYEYLEVVAASLNSINPQCDERISLASQKFKAMLAKKSDRQLLKKMFKLCADIDMSKNDDVSNLLESLAGNFEGIVQYNKDNRHFEGGSQITIDLLCKLMTGGKNTSENALENYAKVNSLLLLDANQTCLDFSYKSVIKELQDVSWKAAVGGRQWIYQTCNEFGWYQTSDSPKQPFGSGFGLKFSAKICSDVFGVFNLKDLEANVNETNTNYGARNLKATRIVFPNGSIDPWHAVGLTKDLNQDAPAIFIQGTAHCANMYPPSKKDPPQLTKARQKIGDLLEKWLAQDA